MSYDVNYVAVIVVAIVHMVIGMLWYSQALFGKTWMKLSGKSMASKDGMGKTYAIAFVAGLVMAYVLSMFVSAMGTATVGAAASLAFWLWLGFVATVLIGQVLWEGKANTLFLINAGFWLVSLVISASIFALWA